MTIANDIFEQSWWSRQFVDYRRRLPFDGVYIDLNEPINFGKGEKGVGKCRGEALSYAEIVDSLNFPNPLMLLLIGHIILVRTILGMFRWSFSITANHLNSPPYVTRTQVRLN